MCPLYLPFDISILELGFELEINSKLELEIKSKLKLELEMEFELESELEVSNFKSGEFWKFSKFFAIQIIYLQKESIKFKKLLLLSIISLQ